MENNLFGNRLRNTRIERNMTQLELAEAANVAVNSIRLYESGSHGPSIRNLDKIANALGVSVEYLITDHSQQPPFAGYAGNNNKLATPNSDLSAIMDKVADMLNAADGQHPAGESINALLQDYSALNATGQQKALERVHELTEVPRYRLEDSDQAPGGYTESKDR